MKNKDVPGILFIDPEFGMDQTEVTNFHWREFLYWTERTYGKQSMEYTSMLPDSSLWISLDTANYAMEDFYFRHQAFRDYPVVGITYEQAEKYCRWRSDRVFEYWLIKSKYWSYNRSILADSTNYVSIERYLNGELEGLKPTPDVDRFPYYHLPSEKEWNRTMKYNEEQLLKLSKGQLKLLAKATGRDEYDGKFLPAPVDVSRGKKTLKWIAYLDQNVSELLSDGHSAIGKNWSGKIEPEDIFKAESASVFVGFRCAFEWKEPKKAAQ